MAGFLCSSVGDSFTIAWIHSASASRSTLELSATCRDCALTDLLKLPYLDFEKFSQ